MAFPPRAEAQLMGGEHGRRSEVPERGQILRFPCGSRQGPALGGVPAAAGLRAENCADPFGGCRSPFEGECYMTTVDAIYLSSIALVAVVIAYSCVRFWFGE
jgi:hypothetical protein